MGFEADWSSAKKTFESSTGKKKPDAKFMGVFRTSGVSDLLKKLDTAIAKGVIKDMESGLEAVGKSASSYHATLIKAEKDDKTENYSAEVKKLADALDKIVRDAGIAVHDKIEQVQKGASETLLKTADEMATKAALAIKTVFDGGRKELAGMEKAADTADGGLRAVVAAQAKADAKTAKTEAENIKKAVEALKSSQKKMIAGRDKAADLFSKLKAEIKKLKLPPGRNAADGKIDTMDAMVMKYDELVEQGQAEVDAGTKSLNDAASALKGTLDTEAIYVDSCAKLAKRANDAAMKADAAARDIGGQADRAGQEAITAKEAKEEGKTDEMEKALKVSAVYVQKGRIEADENIKEIEAAGRSILATRKSFPTFVNDKNAKFKDSLAEVDSSMQILKESREGLLKAKTKFDRAEKEAKELT